MSISILIPKLVLKPNLTQKGFQCERLARLSILITVIKTIELNKRIANTYTDRRQLQIKVKPIVK